MVAEGPPRIVRCRACGRSVVNHVELLAAHLSWCCRALLPSTLHGPLEARRPDPPRSGRKPDLSDYDTWNEEMV